MKLFMLFKRSGLLTLFISLGIMAFGIGGLKALPLLPQLFHVPPGNYNGMTPALLFILVMMVGVICSVLSWLWCVGWLIVAIFSYIREHPAKTLRG
jgi:hypothetical protein